MSGVRAKHHQSQVVASKGGVSSSAKGSTATTVFNAPFQQKEL